ncbi:MAG: molybdate ABC transporter substrate-binding protein [Gammaproteobacteria bacterium]|nr:molybdate ABC transporter substrate-binding protein [Gammaproteobacteria bacterium]
MSAKILWLISMISLCPLLLPDAKAQSNELRLAVASNFAATLKELREDFKLKTRRSFSISQASTGKLYAQIVHGAPYDIFMAADSKRPELLAEQGLAFEPVVYGRGQLTLVIKKTPSVNCADPVLSVLNKKNFNKLAVASAKTAPYGVAAEEFIRAADKWNELEPSLVRGESVLQAFHYLESANADAGLIASSLLTESDGQLSGRYCQWQIPLQSYRSLEQKMVILKNTNKLALARLFSEYLKSEGAKAIIKSNGYLVD